MAMEVAVTPPISKLPQYGHRASETGNAEKFGTSSAALSKQ